eukprot:m.192254 g.192254  ORF g.192254 m.192254 type:complete len:283 (-) comp25733_c0_seq1:39-887(-)
MKAGNDNFVRLYPGPETPTRNLMVFLHGVGDDSPNMAALAKRLDFPDTTCLCLRGFERVPEFPGFCHFPAFEPDGLPIQPRPEEFRRVHGLFQSGHKLAHILKHCYRVSKNRWSEKTTFFFTIGDGGILALYTALALFEQPVGGIVCLSSQLFLEEAVNSSMNLGTEEEGAKRSETDNDYVLPPYMQELVNARDVPFFVNIAKKDPQVTTLRKNADICKKTLGFEQLEVHEYAKASASLQSDQEVKDLMSFLGPRMSAPQTTLENDPTLIDLSKGGVTLERM